MNCRQSFHQKSKNPHPRIWNESITATDYCYASPIWAGEVGSRATANYSLLTANSYFTMYDNSCDSAKKTVFEYDILNRRTRATVYPYNYTTITKYGFGPVGGRTCFSTIVTDAKGNADTVLKGTMGQQLEQRLPMGVVTGFGYDRLGQLERSTDPDGFSTEYWYDKFGQLTHRHHPDAGDDLYEYDPAGNLTRHTNTADEHLDYKYNYNQLTDVLYSHYPDNNVHYEYGTAANANINAVGKIILQEDASGWQTFSYGKLGEVTENICTFALPFDDHSYTFKMQYQYDSYNRIQRMTYPDGEVVSYGYNKGGMLENIRGNKNGDLRTYVESIRYNKFELKESEIYGNATWMSYEYDSLLRLSHLYSWDGNGDIMQDIGYTYDYVGNITDIANSAVTLPNGLGGSYYSHYDYDPLYRLTGAYGDWNNNQLSYNLGMQYYGNGKIWSKQLYADVLDQGNVTVRDYNNRYYYGSSTSNTVTSVYDQIGHVWQSFSWDMAGNMVYHQDANGCGRTLCWDEENRLMSFADCENAGFYQYDAGGERTYKLTSDYVSQNIGGHWHTYQVLDNPTLYTSPYMVATPKGYTKHYYAESERVASRIGGGLDSVDMFIQNFEEFIDKPTVEISPLWTDDYHEEFFDEKRHHNLDHLYSAMECADNVPTVLFECLTILYKYSQYPHHEYEPDCYWYHPDHLGSSSWITFSDGSAVQHLHYLPWGENFVDQRTSSFSSMYTFSAKEKDTETGYSYFGSRYYNSDLSIWLSVDPMAMKYPSLSPYVYCADNPVKLVDPNGEEIFDDIVIHGKNKSSITIKTSLIDLELNANVDFGGNYTLSSENVALGFQTEFVATGQAGIGTSYGGFKSKIMFFGGDYSGYWYDYIGGDMQVLCGVSVEASVGFQTSLVLGIYTGEKGGNTPMSFAGAYTGLSCSAGLKATLCGINLNASSSKALNNKWDVFTFGVSFTQGYQGGIGLSIGSEFGSAKLITKQIPTKDRTIRDRVKNILSH